MTETVNFVAADGTTLNLTDYSTYYLQSRRGFGAPPVALFSERLPNSPGARYTGTVVHERTVSFSVRVKADTWEASLAANRVAVNAFVQGGYLESITGANTRRLAVTYAGGLDGDTSSRSGNWLTLVPEFRAYDAYWYDPVPQSYIVDVAGFGSGLPWPRMYPIFFGLTGTSGAFSVTTGDAPSPWSIEALGPFTRLELVRLDTNDTLDVTYPVLSGQQLQIDTHLGARRVWLDTGANRINATSGLSSTSVFWQLKPGSTPIAVRVTGGNGANRATLRWTNSYYANG